MLSAADFCGQWHLKRQISDRAARQSGHLKGTANLVNQGDGLLRYDETGAFQLAQGPVMQAARRYQWRFSDVWVDVQFEDGRPFHGFVPDGLVDGTDHPCGADHYQVQYDFRNWPDWQARWTVIGPRKDYTSVSHYSKLMG